MTITKRRAKQIRKARDKAVRTGEAKDLKEYLDMRKDSPQIEPVVRTYF